MQIYNPRIRIYKTFWLIRVIFRRPFGVDLKAGVPWEGTNIRGASETLLASGYCKTLGAAKAKANHFAGRISGYGREVPVIHDFKDAKRPEPPAQRLEIKESST